MHKIYVLVILCAIIFGCSDNSSFNASMSQQEVEQSEAAAKAFWSARDQAERNDPSGFLKLYEIARDDTTYTVEYSEVAAQELVYLLYFKTELWIKIFSKVDQKDFITYLKQGGLALSRLPEGVASEKEFDETILKNLKQIKGNKSEMALINYIVQTLEKFE